MRAVLALEDGRIFRGKSFGAPVERTGEVVFNTSLTGYQEIFTDPSYAGQIVVLTNPHIGNYGTTPADAESARPMIEGLVTREFSPISSNWRSSEVADEYLERNGIPVIAEVDTRAVVRHLRARQGRPARWMEPILHPSFRPGRPISGTLTSQRIRPVTSCWA
jgi:carbamoyl-phosphate synthase small subunit